MADVTSPGSPQRRMSDVGPRTWSQDSCASSPAFSPLQRLRQGPTFQPLHRRSPAGPLRSLRVREEMSRDGSSRTDTNCEQGLEAEIEGLQKALEEGRCREQFAVRRRLHQLQNVARGSLATTATSVSEDRRDETVDELEKVKTALEDLRRGGEEEKLHRSQLEERVMREIEDLKSPSKSPQPGMGRSSRQLADERERKRSQAHAEVQELTEALAELRVTCADELEAQRLEQLQFQAERAKLQELQGFEDTSQALRSQLAEAEAALLQESSEVQKLRRDVQEQDEVLASFWSLQASFKREAAEASRHQQAALALQEELQTCRQGDAKSSSHSELESERNKRLRQDQVIAELRAQVDSLSRLRPLEESVQHLFDTERACRSSLKDLPKSFQEDLSAVRVGGRSGSLESEVRQHSEWCASTIKKLSAFATSMLQENARLRQRHAEMKQSPQSADEAGGHVRDLRDLDSLARVESQLEAAEGSRQEAEAALRLRSAECAKMAEAESKAEARLKTLEMRMAPHPNGARKKSDKPKEFREVRADRAKPEESPRNPANLANLANSVHPVNLATKAATSPRSPDAKRSPRLDKAKAAPKKSEALEIPVLERLRLNTSATTDRSIPSSCLYNSDSSSGSSAARRGAAYPPSPESGSPDPPHRWTNQFRQSDCSEASQEACREKRWTQMEMPKEICETKTSAYLPGSESAADVFARAEALCESQRFAEAAELFRCVLAALRTSPDRHALRSVEAEVWAHLGVAMQSLDDIAAAIESYCQAVRLDPSLHVCFANLATLYMYLEDFQKAQALKKEGETAGMRSLLQVPLGPGLKSLQSLSQQLVAEEHWEAQFEGEAAEAAKKLPQLHAIVLAQVWDQEDLLRLAATLSSIRQQWRAPCCFACGLDRSSPQALEAETQKLLDDFKEAIEAPGPRMAYSDGLARAVLCKGGKLITAWAFGEQAYSIMAPRRTAFFRNFTRQANLQRVPGPETCLATAAPLIVRPTQVGFRAPGAGGYEC
ncbi:unnamed protein product [Effrenium voratum]|nr:unnamed protein product [Effrenium voratum]